MPKKKQVNYAKWSIKKLLTECIRRGLLDYNHKYTPVQSQESILRRVKLDRFMRSNNMTFDEMFALFDLADQEPVVRKRLINTIDDY